MTNKEVHAARQSIVEQASHQHRKTKFCTLSVEIPQHRHHKVDGARSHGCSLTSRVSVAKVVPIDMVRLNWASFSAVCFSVTQVLQCLESKLLSLHRCKGDLLSL